MHYVSQLLHTTNKNNHLIFFFLPAYLLANKGYDVWLLNFRGNDYSENHTSQNPNTSSDYWNFSWHEMGLYDIPATVNYTTNQTGQDNVTLICYSQGCSAAFVAGIYNPNITDQIKFTSAMAPGVYMGNTQYQNVKWMAMSEFPLKVSCPKNDFILF